MKYFKVYTADLSAPVLIVKAESLDDAIATAKRNDLAYTLGEEYKEANRCDRYRRQQIKEQRTTMTGRTYYVDFTVSVCYGSSQPRRCRCGGHRDKCELK